MWFVIKLTRTVSSEGRSNELWDLNPNLSLWVRTAGSLGNPEGYVSTVLCRAYANLVAEVRDTVGIRLILNKPCRRTSLQLCAGLNHAAYGQVALNPGALKGRSGQVREGHLKSLDLQVSAPAPGNGEGFSKGLL